MQTLTPVATTIAVLICHRLCQRHPLASYSCEAVRDDFGWLQLL